MARGAPGKGAESAIIEHGAESFRDMWSAKICPVIQKDCEGVLKMPPTRVQKRSEKKEQQKEEKKATHQKEKTHDKKRQEEEEEECTAESAEETAVPDEQNTKDAEAIYDKMNAILQDVKEAGERRNAYMNLAFTEPVDNTPLQANIPFAKVVNCALDMFVDCSESLAASSASTASKAASAPVDEEGSEKRAVPQTTLVERVAVGGARKRNIPETVESGYELPICITNTDVVPSLVQFKRFGMDVVVNAVWLAFFWAKDEGNDQHQHVREQTRAWCSDGADLKVPLAASAFFPRLAFHAWDECHSSQRLLANSMGEDEEITITD